MTRGSHKLQPLEIATRCVLAIVGASGQSAPYGQKWVYRRRSNHGFFHLINTSLRHPCFLCTRIGDKDVGLPDVEQSAVCPGNEWVEGCAVAAHLYPYEEASYGRISISTTLIQGVVIVGLMTIHLFAGRLRFLDGVPRSRWLSIAGGTSIAYVFLHIFPELSRADRTLAEHWQSDVLRDDCAYLVALLGVILFYGLERLVKVKRQEQGKERGGEGETTTDQGTFWLHVASFAVYNALIGYLLVKGETESTQEYLLFGVAIGLHFLVNDYSLRQDHRVTYQRKGRWILTAAILVGWLSGRFFNFGESFTGALFAFIAGGIILNVLKEELPESRNSRFLPFLLGGIGYSALLMLI